MFESRLTPREKKIARRKDILFCLAFAIAIAFVVLFAVGLSILIGS